MRKNRRISSYQEDYQRIFSLNKTLESTKKHMNINPDRLHNRKGKFINSISEPGELVLANFDSFFTKLSAKQSEESYIFMPEVSGVDLVSSEQA